MDGSADVLLSCAMSWDPYVSADPGEPHSSYFTKYDLIWCIGGIHRLYYNVTVNCGGFK